MNYLAKLERLPHDEECDSHRCARCGRWVDTHDEACRCGIVGCRETCDCYRAKVIEHFAARENLLNGAAKAQATLHKRNAELEEAFAASETAHELSLNLIAELESFVAAFDEWDATPVDPTGVAWAKLETARVELARNRLKALEKGG